MTNVLDSKNPFQITTPEDLSAKDVYRLFVDVFSEFPEIIDPGHVFLMGPRGVGKSMMLRYLQADCQLIAEKRKFSELPFLGIYIPIKNESFVKTELKRLDDRHAAEIFNEHLMISHISIKIFDTILNNIDALESINKHDLFVYYKDVFLQILYPNNLGKILDSEVENIDILKNIIYLLNNSYRIPTIYAKKLAFSTDLPIYDGPLFDYHDFLVPVFSELIKIDGFPQKTIYLLLDDAHFLSEVQTRILNSWIATRTSKKISLKVSSQYNYKNYYTVTGATIDSPHDYSEIDMTQRYTSNRSPLRYRDRIKNIINKRLELVGINVSAEDFFPPDIEQEQRINKIAEEYKTKFDQGNGQGYYRTDDAYRYARPDFIKSLGGSSKSTYTYSYAGFDQLVHLSSGIVRYFLEPAHIMYSTERTIDKEKEILFISPSIQSKIAYEEADRFLFIELEKFRKEGDEAAVPKEDIDRLSNLVQGLGGLFRQILVSERSERRVFSIAISDKSSELVERILNIGVDFGFFHLSTIGRKDRNSTGRTKLFVMNRRLAPIWRLDPTGFAGYLFIKNSVLEDGIQNPQSMLSRLEKNNTSQEFEIHQLRLFDSFGDISDMPYTVYDSGENQL